MARYTITRTFEIDTDAWNERYTLKYTPFFVKGLFERRLDEAINKFAQKFPGVTYNSANAIDLSDIKL